MSDKENQLLFQKTISTDFSGFVDSHYSFNKRLGLNNPIKCATNMVSDMLKSLTKDKITFPSIINIYNKS